MKIEELLSGPQSERSHADALAGKPMSAAEARKCIADTIAATNDARSFRPVAQAALKVGKLSDGARQLYRQYLDASE